MRSMTLSEARDDLAETVNLIAYRGERVTLTRHGKAVAALVSAEDLALLEALEDRADIEAARAAIREGDFEPWGKVKAELDL